MSQAEETKIMLQEDMKVVIMAAGEGTRMRSSLPKVLHQAAGKCLVEWVADAARAVTEKPVLIYGNGGEAIRERFGEVFTYALQAQRLGTGHAVMAAREQIAGSKYTIVLAGDMPLVRPETIKRLAEEAVAADCDCMLLTASPEKTPAYGRIVRDAQGKICRIVEDKDATPEQKQIKELNISFYCFKTPALLEALDQLKPENAQHEYYLTDCIQVLYEAGKEVRSIDIGDMQECMGVNTRVQLAEAEAALRARINEKLMLSGVTMIDPTNTYIGADVEIGQDTLIYPGVILEGKCRIGSGCILYQGSRIRDSIVGDGTTVENSVLLQAEAGSCSKVGPNAYLRPGTRIGNHCRIGDFVETKNAVIGDGTKVSHLTYVGDAQLGEDINIGCGVVFVNFDGKEKKMTTVGDGAFIGCNTNLISPVQVGAGAYIAAGTTVTKDVPEDALAIGRARELVKAGWAKGRYKIHRE